jgi:hypothetical protein
MTMAVITDMADPDVNAGTDVADMNPDADLGICRCRAQKGQCENRSYEGFHEGSLSLIFDRSPFNSGALLRMAGRLVPERPGV